jgi:hypothetical protein
MARTMKHDRKHLRALGIAGFEASAKTAAGREKLQKMHASAVLDPMPGEVVALAVVPPSKTVVLAGDEEVRNSK